MLAKKSAFIFPGQGAQYVGMLKGLYNKYVAAKEIFNQAEEALGFDIKGLCFEGPPEELTQTRNCQPAILTASIAALRALLESGVEINVTHTAGLSLGEYSALVAAGSLDFKDAVKLARLRGKFMEQASTENPGTLIAIVGMDLKTAEVLCSKSGAQIANLNCPGQVVVAAALKSVDKVKSLAEHLGAKRAVSLDVSGPFHSSLMQSASVKLEQELQNVNILTPNIEFIPNVSAAFTSSEQDIKEALVRQVASTTYWERSITLMRRSGVTVFYEIGPGKVLKGLLRKIDRELKVINIEKPEDLEQILNQGS